MNILPMIIGLLLILTGLASCNYIETTTHENLHKEIMERYGCTEVNVEISLLKGSTAQCLSYNERKDTIREEDYLHLLNEIESYNNNANEMFLTMLIIGGIFLLYGLLRD